MEELNDIYTSNLDFTEFTKHINAIRDEISKHVLGQQKMVDLLMIALLSEGHVLIEGVPGLAKTLTANILSKTIQTKFKRIQFTPDLLPSDIIGTSIYNMQSSSFTFNKGPLFTNILLADEINRAPAKTQSALFEAMEERKVSVDGNTYELHQPFIVVATQNPIDLEGTYRLPEAQIDRFLFKIDVDYPSIVDEVSVMKAQHRRKGKVDLAKIPALINEKELMEVRALVKEVKVEEKIFNYIAEIVYKTRNNKDIYLGASPRASLGIMTASKAQAAMAGRDFVTPDDVRFVAPYVLTHRVILSPDKEIEGVQNKQFVLDLINTIEVPR